MLYPTAAIIFLAVVNSANSAITPDEQLIIGEDNVGYWVQGNTSTEITSLANFNKSEGITGNPAIHVEPGPYSVVRRLSSDDCIADIESCPDSKITFTFWLKVSDWGDSSTKYLFRASSITSRTGLVIHTGSSYSTEFRILFNGNGYDHETFVSRSEVEQWTYVAIVADANENTMKVYLNGTEVPDIESEVEVETRNSRWISLGGTESTTPTYDIDGIKIYFTALTQEQLQGIFEETVSGEAVATMPELTTASPETETTTTSEPPQMSSTTTTAASKPPTATTTTAQTTTTISGKTTPMTTTMETPETTTTRASTTACDQVSEEFTKAFDDWNVQFEEYKAAFDEWREKKNNLGSCQ